jgi:hypothetical protein
VTVGDVTVSNITVGTIRLESSGDVRGDVDKYFRGTSIRLQSARVRVKIDSAACSCEIFKNGRLLFSEDAPAELRDGIICIVMEHKR